MILGDVCSLERLEPSDGSSEDKCMNIMSPLVCVDSLEVADVSDDVILVDNAVATEHVPGVSSNLQGLSAVVALDHGYHLGSETALLVLQARDPQHRVETQGDLCAHVRHLLLHQLGLGKGASELLAVQENNKTNIILLFSINLGH